MEQLLKKAIPYLHNEIQDAQDTEAKKEKSVNIKLNSNTRTVNKNKLRYSCQDINNKRIKCIDKTWKNGKPNFCLKEMKGYDDKKCKEYFDNKKISKSLHTIRVKPTLINNRVFTKKYKPQKTLKVFDITKIKKPLKHIEVKPLKPKEFYFNGDEEIEDIEDFFI